MASAMPGRANLHRCANGSQNASFGLRRETRMIHRADHTDNYMVISNRIARDERLSFEARGLLVFMLSMSDDWNFSIKGLVNQTGMKRSVILRIVKELRDCGYILIKQETKKDGKFTAKTWELYENCTVVRFDRSRSKPQSVKTDYGKTETIDFIDSQPQSDLTVVGENRSTVLPRSVKTVVGENEPIRNTNIERNTKLVRNTKEKEIGKRFAPPTVEEVAAYCLERGNEVNADDFVNFYTSKGWMVGKNKMKDWKAAVRTWESKDRSHAASKKAKGNEFIDMLREEAVGND